MSRLSISFLSSFCVLQQIGAKQFAIFFSQHWGRPVCAYHNVLMTLISFAACILSRGMFLKNILTISRYTTFWESTRIAPTRSCPISTSSGCRRWTRIRKTSWQAFSRPIHGCKKSRICWSLSSIWLPRPSRCKVCWWQFSWRESTFITYVRSRVNIREQASGECG